MRSLEMVFTWMLPPEPKPEPEKKADEPDVDLLDRVAAFVNLGVDELLALKLAWSDVSPSEMRELLKKHCPVAVAADILL